MPGLNSIPSLLRSDPIHAGLVRLLYTALPQVASVTTGVVVGAWLMAWRTAVRLGLAAGLAVDRHGGDPTGAPRGLLRSGADKDLSPAAARRWGCAYGAGSLLMAAVIAGMSLRALAETDAGVQLLCLGLTMATCAGQSSTRVACGHGSQSAPAASSWSPSPEAVCGMLISATRSSVVCSCFTVAPDCRIITERGPLKFRNGAYTYEISRQGSSVTYTVSDGKNSIAEPILYCFGQGHVGQTYLFRHNDLLYETRVSYFQKLHGLDFTIGHQTHHSDVA